MLTQAWVYIMASHSRCIYIGVTRDLHRRWCQHREGAGSRFVREYRVHRLVHVERFDRLIDAVSREKQLKRWRRSKKVALIRASNPGWRDLAEGYGWLRDTPRPERSSGNAAAKSRDL